jgi:hypothetical protein
MVMLSLTFFLPGISYIFLIQVFEISSLQIMLRCPYVEKINLALFRNWMLPVLGSGGGPDVM